MDTSTLGEALCQHETPLVPLPRKGYDSICYPIDGPFLRQLQVHPLVIAALASALNELIRNIRAKDNVSPTEAAHTVLLHLARASWTQPSHVPFDHLLWLAVAHVNGIRFRHVEDVTATMEGLFTRLSAAATIQQKPSDMLIAGCQLFHQLGSQVADGPVKDVLSKDLVAEVLLEAVDLLGSLRTHIAPHKCLQIAVLRKRHRLELRQVRHLFDHVRPHRMGNVLELLARGSITPNNIGDLIDAVEFVDELPFDDLRELLVGPPAGIKTPTATVVARTATVTSSPKLLATIPGLHKQLKVIDLLGDRANVEAVQIILVYGVLQPHRSSSAFLAGARVEKEELLEIIQPHVQAAGFNKRQIDAALQQICSVGTMGTSGDHKNKRVRFLREPGNGSPIGKELARRVCEFHDQLIRRPS